MTESEELLRAKLNAETGKLAWPELERHFARGVVIKVLPDLDLLDVALAMARDDKASVAHWLEEGRLARADAEDARQWHAQQSLFWAVVAAPWVLIQEVAARQDA
ncbi:MAG: DUF2288 domain-containing protein [Pseudomonadota bacterium]